MKKLICLLLVPIFLVSCSSSLSELDMFIKNFRTAHPDGYYVDGWVSFSCSMEIDNNIDGIYKKHSISFIGDVSFDKNGFHGFSNKCEWTCTIEIMDPYKKIIQTKEEHYLTNDNKTFLEEVETDHATNQQTKKTWGSNDSIATYIYFDNFDSIVFVPETFPEMNKYGYSDFLFEKGNVSFTQERERQISYKKYINNRDNFCSFSNYKLDNYSVNLDEKEWYGFYYNKTIYSAFITNASEKTIDVPDQYDFLLDPAYKWLEA